MNKQEFEKFKNKQAIEDLLDKADLLVDNAEDYHKTAYNQLIYYVESWDDGWWQADGFAFFLCVEILNNLVEKHT